MFQVAISTPVEVLRTEGGASPLDALRKAKEIAQKMGKGVLDSLTWSLESCGEEDPIPVIPGMTCGTAYGGMLDAFLAWKAIDHAKSPKMGNNPTVDAIIVSLVEDAVGAEMAPKVWAMYT